MRRRPITKFRPALEQFEDKKLPSAGALTTPAAAHAGARASQANGDKAATGLPHGFLGFRVTNPSAAVNYLILPPLKQVLVQKAQPVAGQTYNLLQVAVRNGTSQTFTPANNFTVRLNVNKKDVFPVLTGNETWAPKQIIVFYILTKKYYPLPQTYGGFQLDLGGRSSTLVPGPSAIFVKLKYNPATFANTLDVIVAGGQGNQGGKGSFFGIPNTSINNIVSAKTNRNDFGGHF